MKQSLTLFGFAACCHLGLGLGCGFGEEGSLEDRVGMPTGQGSARRAAAGSGDDLEQLSAQLWHGEKSSLIWQGAGRVTSWLGLQAPT